MINKFKKTTQNQIRYEGSMLLKKIVLPPTQQTTVNVRTARTGRQDIASTGLLENGHVNGLSHVYSARILIPFKFTGIKIALLRP